jgi:hypothetical protein
VILLALFQALLAAAPVTTAGRLAARHRTLGGPLLSTGPDAFLLGEVRLSFVREGGRVTGLLLDCGQVRGLRYVRRATD